MMTLLYSVVSLYICSMSLLWVFLYPCATVQSKHCAWLAYNTSIVHIWSDISNIISEENVQKLNKTVGELFWTQFIPSTGVIFWSHFTSYRHIWTPFKLKHKKNCLYKNYIEWQSLCMWMTLICPVYSQLNSQSGKIASFFFF